MAEVVVEFLIGVGRDPEIEKVYDLGIGKILRNIDEGFDQELRLSAGRSDEYPGASVDAGQGRSGIGQFLMIGCLPVVDHD